MNKIGILTFHAAHNYGSVLQSYASVMTLRKLGYMPEIINLRNQAQIDAYRIFHSGDSITRKAFNLLLYPKLRSRFRKFEHFINHILPVSAKEYRSGKELDIDKLDYDIYYTGSDQVWNPACQDFESAYYLDFVNHRRPTVAYAPSMGKATFDVADEKRIKGCWFMSIIYPVAKSAVQSLSPVSAVAQSPKSATRYFSPHARNGANLQ